MSRLPNHEAPLRAQGFFGFKNVDANNSPYSAQEGTFVALQAVGGDATLGSSTTSAHGDDPVPSLTIPDGAVIVGRFDQVEVTSGTVQAYYDQRQ
jgi:hypothetical protein